MARSRSLKELVEEQARQAPSQGVTGNSSMSQAASQAVGIPQIRESLVGGIVKTLIGGALGGAAGIGATAGEAIAGAAGGGVKGPSGTTAPAAAPSPTSSTGASSGAASALSNAKAGVVSPYQVGAMPGDGTTPTKEAAAEVLRKIKARKAKGL